MESQNFGVNKLILLGLIETTPKLSYTANQVAIAEFRLATTSLVKSVADESFREQTQLHPVEAKGRLAEFCASALKQGQRIYLEGHMEYRKKSHVKYKDVSYQMPFVVAHKIQAIDSLEGSPEYPEDLPKIKRQKKG